MADYHAGYHLGNQLVARAVEKLDLNDVEDRRLALAIYMLSMIGDLTQGAFSLSGESLRGVVDATIEQIGNGADPSTMSMPMKNN